VLSVRFLKMELNLAPLSAPTDRTRGELVNTWVPSVGLTLALDMNESLDLCYASDSVDDTCIAFLRERLQRHSYFVDAGANQGLYSCLALHESSRIGVIALEPDPYSQEKLRRNLELNSLDSTRFTLLDVALGESVGTAELMLNTAGNRAGSSLVVDQRAFTGLEDNLTVQVTTAPLTSVVESLGHDAWILKMDIEGMEYPVLKAYLRDAARDTWPRAVIVEAFGRSIHAVGGSPVQLLVEHGYNLVDHDESNFCLELRP